VNKIFWIITAMVGNTVAAATILSQQSSIGGDWSGSISVAGQAIPMSVHFTVAEDELSAAIDIQGATGLPLQSVSYQPPKVHFELPAGGSVAVFDGEHTGDSIGGAFTQAGITGTFTLVRAVAEAAADEVEAEPLPYDAEEVTFHNADITLAGTLTLPRTGAPHPAVVMITGSGPQNRDEELFGFKLFQIIADHLTRNGVAVLRYDDRGVGGSTGSVSQATSEDFAADVIAAVDLLKNRNDIHPARIGLMGHSEGGIVAPIAASQSDDIAFMVLMAGTSVTGAEIIFEQSALIARTAGASETDIERQSALQRRVFAVVRAGEGWDELSAALRSEIEAGLAAMPDSQRSAISDVDAYVEAQVQGQITASRTPWFQFFIDYDPAATLRAVDTPVLALFGELDLQVTPGQNRGPMEEALRAGNHPDYTIRVLPNANHLFITANTGSPAEYGSLPKEFVPEFLPMVTDWILERIR
jgi:hypothetical protein